jgi:hypothetical protein
VKLESNVCERWLISLVSEERGKKTGERVGRSPSHLEMETANRQLHSSGERWRRLQGLIRNSQESEEQDFEDSVAFCPSCAPRVLHQPARELSGVYRWFRSRRNPVGCLRSCQQPTWGISHQERRKPSSDEEYVPEPDEELPTGDRFDP